MVCAVRAAPFLPPTMDIKPILWQHALIVEVAGGGSYVGTTRKSPRLSFHTSLLRFPNTNADASVEVKHRGVPFARLDGWIWGWNRASSQRV